MSTQTSKRNDFPSSSVIKFSTERTVFFVQKGDQLQQVIFVDIELEERISKAKLEISSKYGEFVRNIGRINAGKSRLEVHVPEVSEPTDFRIVLRWDANEIGTTVKVFPEKHWKVHVIHHSHLDIGYTDIQPDVLDFHLTYLDQVLEFCDLTDTEDPDTSFKWVIEVTWPLKYWLESRPKSKVNKMVRRIREGRIEVAGGYMNMHTEAFHIDQLARTFETAQQLRDQYGMPIDTVLQTDVPGHTLGFLKCLTSMGIKYLSVAHNYAGRSVPHLVPGPKLERPFYWQQEDGQKVLVWYTDTPHGVYTEGNRFGLADSFDESMQKLPKLFEQLREENYALDIVHLRVQGAYWDNAGPSLIPSQVAQEWNKKWAFPKLIISTNRKVFQELESKDMDIPVFTGDWTSWWADGIGSAAYENGINRKAHHLIRAAETFHSIADMKGCDKLYPKEVLQNAYENMVLFDEHTWGAANLWDKTLTENTSGHIQWNLKQDLPRPLIIKDFANTAELNTFFHNFWISVRMENPVQ